METNYLLAEPVKKLLTWFAIPCVLSMLVSALYNIVDQIFIGQSVGYLGNAATTVVYPFTVIAMALALLIGDGSGSLFSLSLGSGDRETGHRCIGNAIGMVLITGIALMAIGFAGMDGILGVFGVTEASYPYAVDYMQVILIGIPFYMFTLAANAPIRSDGAPGYAMCATVLGAVLNLILDPIAIFGLGLGVRGAAIATVISQIASAVMSALYFRRTKLFRLQRESFRPSGRLIRRISQLGVSSLIMQISIVVITCVANNLCRTYGAQSVYGPDIPLSALGIVFKVFGIVIAFSIGIAMGAQPIVGYNYGAERYDRVFETYRLAVIANLVVGAVSMLLFELCPQLIVSLFGSESALYNGYACMCFRIYLGGILLCCLSKVTSFFLQSIGRPIQSALLSLSRDIIFLVPGVVLLAHFRGVEGMLWAGPIADVLAFALAVLFIALERRALRRKTAPSGQVPAPEGRPAGGEAAG